MVDSSSRGLLFVYRGIVMVLLALIAALIGGSLYAFVRSPDSGPLFRIGSGAAAGGYAGLMSEDDGSAYDGGAGVFSGIGRLRIPLSGQEHSAAVILSISFPYAADDRPFVEEITSRTGEFRSIASAYFAALPLEAVIALDEEAAKSEILRRYNALLRLGKIETVYFSDLMIIE